MVCVRLSRSMIDDFLFWYCVEGVVICYGGTDALVEVTDLDVDIP